MKPVESENLRITYRKGKTVAVDGLSFSVDRGDIFVFIGPDGAGKSSTFKAVCGVLSYDSGRLLTFGVDPNNERAFEPVKEKISFMPQGLGQNLYKRLSVEENVNFFADLYGVDKEEREKRKELLLKTTGLWEFRDRPAGKLSGGMMQKLSLCCILIHRPELLVLDEPTTGVDPVSRREIWRLLYSFNREGQTVLLSTSYMDEAERGTELLLMKSGKAVVSGAYEEVVRMDAEVFLITSGNLFTVYEELWKITNTHRLKGDTIRVVVDREKRKEFEELRRKLGFSATPVEPDLEDVFVRKVGLRRVELPPAFKPRSAVPEDAVVVEKVVKKFGSFTAVDGVSFSVKRGEIFGLLGPNGAGKTTLIKTILGLYRPTSGRVLVAGKPVNREVKKLIGYMSQKFSLYQDLTVLENLIYWGSVYGIPPSRVKSLVSEVSSVFELDRFLSRRVSELPLGIKQRVALLSALVHAPPLLFLDEPTSGVDPVERDIFWQLIRGLSTKFGITVLVTTHYMDESEYCDRVLLMNRGRAVAIDSPRNLKEAFRSSYGDAYLVYTATPFETEEKLRSLGFKTTLFGRKVKVYSKEPITDEYLKRLGVQCVAVKPAQITMEDVFVYRVQNG